MGGQLTQLTRHATQTSRNKARRPRYIRHIALIHVPGKPAFAILITPELDRRFWKDLDYIQSVTDKEGFQPSLIIKILHGIGE